MRTSSLRRALPAAIPFIGALVAKKMVAGYALFNAVHAYGVPRLYRQVAQATRAWGASHTEQREFLRVVKGSIRAPTSAYEYVEKSYLAKVIAHVTRHPELRNELNTRIPPVRPTPVRHGAKMFFRR